METTKVREIQKADPAQSQLEFQRTALLSWITMLRSQPALAGPVRPSSGQGSGPSTLYRDAALQIIKTYSLKSLDEIAEMVVTPKSEMGMLVESILKWGPTAGGWPGPHIHCDGKVYVVNESQWEAFSKLAVKSLAQKLSTAAKVAPAEFADLANAVDTIVAA
jgi:hypothetical protein